MKHHGAVDKSPLKQQICVMDSKCFRSGPIHLVLVGIMAGRQAIRQKTCRVKGM